MQLHYNQTMSKSNQIQVRIDPDTKAVAEAVFAKLGIKPSEAVRMFYHQVSINQGIPFELKIPNAETEAAFKDAEEGRNLVRHRTLKSFKQSLRER